MEVALAVLRVAATVTLPSDTEEGCRSKDTSLMFPLEMGTLKRVCA